MDSNASQRQQQQNTDDILKSLLETEEQRMHILKPHSAAASAGSGGGSSSRNHGGGDRSAPEAADGARIGPAAGADGGDPHSGGVAAAGGGSNPYEDAIREALDLLRKHRSPPPSPYASAAAGAGGAADPAAGYVAHQGAVGPFPPPTAADTERSWRASTSAAATAASPFRPKEQDRLLQHRRDDEHGDEGDPRSMERSLERYRDAHQYDDHDHKAENLLASVGSQEEYLGDALQEVKLKTKQRQERMAAYANRLQEFKSSLPPQQQSHLQSSGNGSTLNSPNHSQQQQQMRPSPYESSSSPQHQGSTGSCEIPAPPMAPTSDAAGVPSSFLTTTTAASPPVVRPPSIPPITSMTDADSVGLISELSVSTKPLPPPSSSYYHPQSGIHHYPDYHSQHQQSATVGAEVQKGVEKVLLAILEASRGKAGDSSSVGGGGGGGIGVDASSTHSGSGHISEALMKAMDEVLHPTHSHNSHPATMMGSSYSHQSGDTVDSRSRGGRPGSSEQRATGWGGSSKVSAKSHESHRSKRSGGERSVVEELLAESDDEEAVVKAKEVPPASAVGGAGRVVSNQLNAEAKYPSYSQLDDERNDHWPREEKKMTEERGSSERPMATTSSKESSKRNVAQLAVGAANDNDIDALIEESLRGSHPPEDTQDEEDISDAEDIDGEDDDLDTEFDPNESYEDDEDDEDDDVEEEEEDNGRKVSRVLGPLSREAGGTTGVVLDADRGHTDANAGGNANNGYFSSVVNYVASALTPDQQKILDDKQKSVTHEMESIESMSTEDIEAMELMRTLCAHLLPYGVDQKHNIEDSIPAWDEDNANEPGYRIIRLSKSQLRRVERAFDKMITGLKRNSQSQLTGVEGYDANFVRELQEAERLLDDEEKRNLIVASKNHSDKVTSALKPSIGAPDHIIEHDDPKEVESAKESSHPDFPGVRTTGKGEMGDLEYFQLPIIFKSHVTGFEPTKDMVLEPGNVVAGQYLVESELGSAAFSTAYRCIDLSSDDNDGHEEVCLKVIKNTKDFFDQSLDEIKILELLRQTGKCDENYIIRMKTFFYHREHLVIVTELLRQNLFEFGKFILDNNEEPYFTVPRLAYITRQCLMALRFVHSLGLVHSDVKPENILLGSYSRAQIKLIDFGSSCYMTDRQSSYIQSRSYRAPEVVLGLPYDGKIDVWSLGCVVAEMYTGDVTFQNDSIVSMLSRIEAICGSFPRHMIAQGRQSGRFFTKSGLLYEAVDDSDQEVQKNPPGPADDDSDSDADSPVQFDIFQPKYTRLSSRLGFHADLMDGYGEDMYSTVGTKTDRQIKQMFTDFVAKLLTIDPDGRPTADEALRHPWMLYAASLTEDQIKYPSS